MALKYIIIFIKTDREAIQQFFTLNYSLRKRLSYNISLKTTDRKLKPRLLRLWKPDYLK